MKQTEHDNKHHQQEGSRPLLDKALVRQRFDRHAFEYDQYASIQQHMAQSLLTNLHADPTIKAILEIGCGTGNLTAELRRRFPAAELVVIDLAPAMINEARKKLASHSHNVTFIIGDAEAEIPKLAQERPRSFDLIVSNATFQWFNDPQQTVRSSIEILKPDGKLLFSTFLERTFEELTYSFSAAERQLNSEVTPHGQSFLTAQDWHQTLANSDWALTWEEVLYHENYKDTRSFLHAVQRIGAGNAIRHNNQHAGMAGRILFQTMEQYYQQHYSTLSGIQATYHIGYGVISKVVDEHQK